MKNLFPIILILFSSCNNSKETTTEPTQENVTEKDSIDIPKIENIRPEGFFFFVNIEQIQYCVFVPTTFYRHDDNADLERGQHIFYREDDSSAYIEIKGLFRSDENVGIKEYFENSYTEDDEAEGKIIEERKSLFIMSVIFLPIINHIGKEQSHFSRIGIHFCVNNY